MVAAGHAQKVPTPVALVKLKGTTNSVIRTRY